MAAMAYAYCFQCRVRAPDKQKPTHRYGLTEIRTCSGTMLTVCMRSFVVQQMGMEVKWTATVLSSKLLTRYPIQQPHSTEPYTYVYIQNSECIYVCMCVFAYT